MTNIKPCTQTRCCYIGTILCPRCSDCNCAPNQIDEDCPNCWNCLKDEGYVRNGKPDMPGVAEVEKNKVVMEVTQK